MSPLAIVVVVLIILAIIATAMYFATKAWANKKNKKESKSSKTKKKSPKHDHSKGKDECPACKASKKRVKKKVPEKCLVIFRPPTDWKGEFGFDWIRDGKMGTPGDVDYSEIMGKYGTDYATDPAAVFTKDKTKFDSLRNGYHSPFKLTWKKDAKGNVYEYCTPCLALYPKDQCTGNKKQYKATLSVEIEIVGHRPDILRVVCDESYFKVDKTKLKPRTKGTHKTDLTIECIKEFDTDQFIKIIPYKTGEDGLAGKIMILRNNKENRFVANVVFVKITTKINGVTKIAQTTGEKDFLERYLLQSLTTLNVKEEPLNLTKDKTFNKDWVMVKKGTKTKVVVNRNSSAKKVHDYLDGVFSKAKPEYADWFKVFFFNEDGGYMTGSNYTGLNGGANGIPSKTVALYKSHNTSTTTHELLHAFGLYHTFDNNGLYTYKIGETDNIMDYSHQSTYGSKDRISTWRWQWDKLKTSLKKE